MTKNKKLPFDILAETLSWYMKKHGWQIILLSSPQVRQDFGARKYNFELVFNFIGKKIKVDLIKEEK